MDPELSAMAADVACGRQSRRHFLGRAAALGVTAAAAQAWLAGAARAAGPVKGGTLRIGSSGGAATDSLDPARASSQVPYFMNRAWGEELTRLMPNGDLEPKLATEWDSSADARVWTFRIRKGVQFHNGKEMTPDDVVATIERHMGPDTKSGALGVLRGIDGVKRNGDTVVVTLKQGNADLPYLLNDYHLVIQPGGGKDAPAAAIGTGPYRMTAFEPGVRWVGQRFANYWAPTQRGHAETLEIIVLNDNTARMAALQSGRVHIINRVDPKVVEMLKRAPGVRIESAAGKGYYCFLAHCNSAPFDNLDLRLAMKYATDRADMVDKVLRGFGSIGNDQPINSSYPLFSPDVPQRPFDLDKAAFHYRKSGYSGTLLLRTSDVAFPGANDAAQLFANTAARAGMKIELRREPADGYWTAVWNKQPFCTAYWGGRATQDQMYSTAFISGADWNDSRYFNPRLDQMVVAARAELNPARRRQIYRDIAVLVNEESGAIIPMFNDSIAGLGPKVGGWVKNPNGELMGGFGPSECWLEA